MTMAKLAITTILAATALSASADGSAVAVGEYHGKGKLILAATAVDGAGETADFVVQHSVNGSDNWADFATFAQVTNAAASTQMLEVDMDQARGFFRAKRTLAGASPTLTASLVLVGTKQTMP